MTASLEVRLGALLRMAGGLARGTSQPTGPSVSVPEWPTPPAHTLRPLLRELMGLGVAIACALLATQAFTIGYWVVGAPGRPRLSPSTLPLLAPPGPNPASPDASGDGT